MPMLAIAGDKATVLSGSAKFIVEEASTATMEFDFSNAVVEEEKTIDEYLTGRGEDFVRDWPQVQSDVVDYTAVIFNKKNKNGMQIVNGGTVQYKIVVHVTAIDFGSTASAIVNSVVGFGGPKKGGASMSGIIEVLDASTNQSLCQVQINNIKGMGTWTGETGRLKALMKPMTNKFLAAAKKS